MTIDQIFSWLFQTLITTGLATAAFFVLLPTKAGEKLLNFHFDKKLADLRDAQNQKLEELKGQISHLGDRGKRWNEREYEAVSNIWDKFVDAFQDTERCIVQYLEFPDLSRMSDDEIKTFLASTDFSEEQRTEVSKATDKNKAYSRVVGWKLIAKANNQIFETRLSLKKRSIFIPADLRECFEEGIEFCSRAQIHAFVTFRNPSAAVGQDEPLKFFQGKDAMFDKVRSAAHKRLIHVS